MAQSSPTTAAGSSPPSIEVDSAIPAGSAALQSPFTIGEPVGRTIRPQPPQMRTVRHGPGQMRRYIAPHRMANATADEEMIAALFERMNGPPRHVDLTPRVHWTTWPLTIAGVCVALIFVLQLSRGFLAAVL